MQPFPIPSPSPFRTAYAAFTGLAIILIGQGALHLGLQPLTILGQPMINSTEDDRGSGRLSNQANFLELWSFRGSGRVNPNPNKPGGELSSVPQANYRGSGRLG